MSPAEAQQHHRATSALRVPIAGVVSGTTSGFFAGSANITRFAAQDGQLVAVGTLTGTITNAAGMVVQSVVANFAAPVAQPQATAQQALAQQAVCSILNLVLGPIHLDLLGLVIDTNQIMLNVTAVPGAGNLLGNLLCAVTGLLDGGGSLQRIANLLNGMLGAL